MPAPFVQTTVPTDSGTPGPGRGAQSGDVGEPDLRAIVRAERVALVLGNTGAALTGNLLVAVLAMAVILPLAPLFLASLWFVVFMAIILVRGWMWRLYERWPSERSFPTDAWGRAILATLILNGLWWGAFSVLLIRYADRFQTGFAPFIIGGMLAAGVATLGSLRSAYLAFTLPMVLSLVGALVWRGGHDSLLMAGFAAAFEVTMIGTVWRVSAIVSRNIELRVQNEHLVDSLTVTNLALGEANRELCHEIEERKRAEARSEFLASHDVLTGLPNRRVQTDRFARAAAQVPPAGGGLVAVLFVDLDRFKQVNDALGHAAGDRLLCVISERLRGCLRRGDSVCRHGGDEFLVLVGEASDRVTVVRVAERILEAVCAPIDLDGRRVQIGCSIGISLYPDDGADFDLLVSHADQALYRAKDQGGDGYCFFTRDSVLGDVPGAVSTSGGATA